MDGLRALFWGMGFVFRRPAVWPLALVPAAIGTALTAAFGYLAFGHVPGLVRDFFGAPSGTVTGFLVTVAIFVVTGAAIALGALLGFALAQPLSGPALERIVRRAEAEVGAPAWPETGLLDDVLRSLSSVLVPLAFGLPILALLVAVDLVLPFASVVTVPVKILVGATMLAWDFCDYPLSIRGVSMHARVAFIRRNVKVLLGFALGIMLLSLVLPCAILLVLPGGVAGAAKLVTLLERHEASRGLAPMASGV